MAKKKRVLIKGFAYTKAALDAPASPEGFEWPANRGEGKATKEQCHKFAGALGELIEAKGLNHMQFAGQYGGEEMLPNGHLQRQAAGQVRRWLDGGAFPSEKSARALAAFFQVPMSRLLEHAGGPLKKMYLRLPKGTKGAKVKRANKLNGAKPPVIKIETIPADASWANVSVSGTLPVDVALGLLAYIERHKAHS